MARNYSSSSTSSSNDFEWENESIYQVPRSFTKLCNKKGDVIKEDENIYQVPKKWQDWSDDVEKSKDDLYQTPSKRTLAHKSTEDILEKNETLQSDYELYKSPPHWPPLLAPTNSSGNKVERPTFPTQSNTLHSQRRTEVNPIISPTSSLSEISYTKPANSFLTELAEKGDYSRQNLYCEDDIVGATSLLDLNSTDILKNNLSEMRASKTKHTVTTREPSTSSTSSSSVSGFLPDFGKMKLKTKFRSKFLKGGLPKLSGPRNNNFKELSKSVVSLIGLDDIGHGSTKSNKRKICNMKEIRPPTYMPAINLFLEGVMAVGKTTLLKSVQDLLGEDVVVVPEPMEYWTNIHDNVLKTLKSVNKKKRSFDDASAVITACQLKFSTPFRVVDSKKHMHARQVDAVIKAAPLHRWILHDRHIISPTVIFPLCHFKNGILSGRDLLQLISTFRCNVTDNIMWLRLNIDENIKRLKKRGRRYEENINQDYLDNLNDCFHAVYCGWLLTQYLSVEHITQLCLGSVTMSSICQQPESPTVLRTSVAEKLFKSSIFEDLKNIFEQYCTDPLVSQLCHTFTTELSKLQFHILNYGDFINDTSGCWTDIYTRCLRNQHIKSLVLDWTAFSGFVEDLNN